MGLTGNLQNLSIPAQHKPGPDSFDARPRSIEKWVAALPMANLSETARSVFKALVDLNRQQLPADQRYRALELLGPPIDYVSDALKKYFIGTTMPLPEKSRKVADIAQELYAETALGYKCVARDTAGGRGRPDKKLLTNALYRAVENLGLVLLRVYQVYAPPPDNLWHDLHELYRYAEQNQLASMLCHASSDAPGGKVAISHAYRRALLLALACPYRFRPHEIDAIYRALNKLTSYVDIVSVDETQSTQGLFVVNLASDSAPSYFSLYKGETFAACRLIDTSRLADRTYELIVDDSPEPSPPISAAVLKRVKSAWHSVVKRSSSRTRRTGQIEAAVGISAIHHFISGQQPFSPVPSHDARPMPGMSPVFGADSAGDRQPANFASRDVHGIGDPDNEPDIWSMNYTSSATSRNNIFGQRSGALPGIVKSNINYTIQPMQMLNVSAGGYCLLCPYDAQCRAQVGDLIALRETDTELTREWGVGVIRRLRSVPNSHLELGVQMITPHAIAVGTRLMTGTGAGGEYLRCLLLPELRAIEQPATLITPTLPFKSGNEVRINVDGQEIGATLGSKLESSESFIQFRFTAHQPLRAESSEDSGEDRFDSVWSSL